MVLNDAPLNMLMYQTFGVVLLWAIGEVTETIEFFTNYARMSIYFIIAVQLEMN